MLQNKFPNLRCLCYSPPGGLLTWELATSCSNFVNSFVLDSDIVPRLSLNNMERCVSCERVTATSSYLLIFTSIHFLNEISFIFEM